MWRTIILLLIIGWRPMPALAIEFTEVAYDLVGADDGHEWLELHNESDQPIDFTGDLYFDGSSHGLAVPPNKGGKGTLVLTPGQYLILADDASQFLADHLNYQGSVIDTVINLANYSADRTMLIHLGLTTKDKVELASADYLPSKQGTSGHTLERQPDNTWLDSSQAGGSPGSPPIVATPKVYSTTIRLSEIYPNPIGSDSGQEWVEIVNDGENSVDMVGWYLTDKSDRRQSLDELSSVPAHAYAVAELPGQFLVNEGEIVTLWQPDGHQLATVNLPKVEQDSSFAWLGGGWQLTNRPTRGTPNLALFAPPTPSPSPRTSPKNSSQASASPVKLGAKLGSFSPIPTQLLTKPTASAVKSKPSPKSSAKLAKLSVDPQSPLPLRLPSALAVVSGAAKDRSPPYSRQSLEIIIGTCALAVLGVVVVRRYRLIDRWTTFWQARRDQTLIT